MDTASSTESPRIVKAVLRQFQRRPLLVRTCWYTIAFCFSILSLLSAVYVESFAASRHCMLFLPFFHLSETLTDHRPLDKLRMQVEGPDERFYVFVLDCSDSINDEFAGVPNWFDEASDRLIAKNYNIAEDREITAYRASKIALYFLLDELVDAAGAGLTVRKKTESTREPLGPRPQFFFAVWDVCGPAEKIFPSGPEPAAVSLGIVDDAIEALEERTDPEDRWTTSFLELFRSLNATHEIAERTAHDKNGRTSFVVTVISDFIDDPDGRGSLEQAIRTGDLHRQAFFETRAQEIREATNNLISDHISFNFLSVSPFSGRDPRLVSFVRERLEWYRFNRLNIMENLVEKKERLLYPVFLVEEPFRVWFDNPLHATGEISLGVEGSEQVSVSLPFEERNDGESLKIKYGRGVSDHEADIEGLLQPGEQTPLTSFVDGANVIFLYEGPVLRGQHMIRVFVNSEKRMYLVPVQFVPRLPQGISWHMVILLVPLFFSAGTLLSFCGLGVIDCVSNPGKHAGDLVSGV